MKPIFLLPPVAALVVAGVWIGSQQADLTALEEKTRVMRERIAAYESLPEASDRPGTAVVVAKKKEPFINEDGSLDWASIGREMVRSQGGGGMPRNLRAFFKIQEKLLAMDGDELAAELLRVRGLEVSAEIKENLESMLIGVLAQRDPEQALTLLEGKLGDSNGRAPWQLRQAFEAWAAKDLVAATAWLDARKEAGAFESKALDPDQDLAREFEVRLLGVMIKDDPAGVRTRLAAMPEDEKRKLLMNASQWTRGEEAMEEYLTLVRENLSDGDRYEAIGEAYGRVVYEGGLEGVTEKLADASLSAEERAAVIEHAVEGFSRPWNRKAEDLREVYPWAEKEAPEQVAELTGEAYARFASHRNTDFEETFRGVLEVAEEQGKPEILEHFANSVERWDGRAEGMKDEGLRARYEELMAGRENHVPGSRVETIEGALAE
ncbi:MAG: hypothetical protein ACSHYF_03650 [Verrucomicrobiaceae bacterium]